MSLATLKTAAYDILQVTSPSAADDVTMLMAFNHARLKAERDHDFVLSKGLAYLAVTATTGSLLSAATAGYTAGAPSGSAVTMKSIRHAKVYDDTAAEWVRAEVMSLDKYEGLIERADRDQPYNGTLSGSIEGTSYQVFDTRHVLYIDGPTIYTPSTTGIDAKFFCYKWLDNYASFAAADDFLITYGPDFLLWDVVVQFNHKKGTFIPRNDGSLSPPTEMRDAAWESLIKWDAYMGNTSNYIIAE